MLEGAGDVTGNAEEEPNGSDAAAGADPNGSNADEALVVAPLVNGSSFVLNKSISGSGCLVAPAFLIDTFSLPPVATGAAASEEEDLLLELFDEGFDLDPNELSSKSSLLLL